MKIARALVVVSAFGLAHSSITQPVITVPLTSVSRHTSYLGLTGPGQFVYTTFVVGNPELTKSYVNDNGVTRQLSFVANGVGRDGTIFGYRMDGSYSVPVVSDATGLQFKSFSPIPNMSDLQARSALGDYAVFGGYLKDVGYSEVLVNVSGVNTPLPQGPQTGSRFHTILDQSGFLTQKTLSYDPLTFSQKTTYEVINSAGQSVGVPHLPLGMDEGSHVFFRPKTPQVGGIPTLGPLMIKNLETGAQSNYTGDDPYGVFLGPDQLGQDGYFNEGFMMNGSGDVAGVIGPYGSPPRLVYYSPTYGWFNLSQMYGITDPVGNVFLTDSGQIGWVTYEDPFTPLAMNMVAAPVPEPGTVAGLGLAGLALASRRRSKRKKSGSARSREQSREG